MKTLNGFLSALLVMMVVLTGCSEEETGPRALEISASDEMRYDANQLEATAGEQVELTLRHSGSMPITAMGHNLVILAQGVDMDEFAAAASAAGADAGYIPTGREADIVAHTELIGGGNSTQISFTAPAAGIYNFLCTFPGHNVLMRGEFVVRAGS